MLWLKVKTLRFQLCTDGKKCNVSQSFTVPAFPFALRFMFQLKVKSASLAVATHKKKKAQETSERERERNQNKNLKADTERHTQRDTERERAERGKRKKQKKLLLFFFFCDEKIPVIDDEIMMKYQILTRIKIKLIKKYNILVFAFLLSLSAICSYLL